MTQSFEIRFDKLADGGVALQGLIDPVPGMPGVFHITSSYGGSSLDNPTSNPGYGPDASGDNYIYYSGDYSGDFSGNQTPPSVPVVDSQGISFHIGGTFIDPKLVTYNVFADPTSSTGYTLTDSDGYRAEVVLRTLQVACFVTGTLIRTAHGDMPVEALAVGDAVVTASGAVRPIRWIGHRTIRCGGAANRDAWPVRVLAHAFAENAPARDLWLSPGHAVCVDVVGEVFIPVGKLVNGATIAEVETGEVTYWHVELDRHDVLLAEGLPAESYLDCGGRAWFAGAEGTADAGHPAGHCRPFLDAGPVVEAVRDRLRARAETLGWSKGTDMDMHLIVDGVRVDPDLADGAARFLLAADASQVELVSRTFVPALWGARGDERRLGLLIGGLHVSDGLRCDEAIDPADPRLGEGFHAPETHDGRVWRWTDGCARLPAELWAGCRPHVFLRIDYHEGASQGWVAPDVAKDPAARSSSRTGNIVALRAA